MEKIQDGEQEVHHIEQVLITKSTCTKKVFHYVFWLSEPER